MQSENRYRMPAFRDSFPNLNDEEYKRVEDALESYLRLTIRFVLDDVAQGRLTLTAGTERPTMMIGSVEPVNKPTYPTL